MRKKQIYQRLSSQNPGWKGSGLPTIMSISKDILKQSVKALQYRKSSIVKNSLRANYANVKNFIVKETSERVFCPCCKWRGSSFIAKSNWRTVTYDASCPNCDSYSRHRGITKLLPQILERIPSGNILNIAPERITLNQLQKHISTDRINTMDKFSIDVDYPGEDLQDLSFEDNMFSMIICNHVLEHVADDEKALIECSRILKSDGIALFTVPGDFQKKNTWIFDKIDDNGHYRHYGIDIIEKMKVAFRNVDDIDMHSICPRNWMVRQHDYAFICIK